MNHWALSVVMAAMAGSVAAETLTYTPQPSATQKAGVASGKPALQSDGRSVNVVLVLQTPTADAKAVPVFLIGVHNAGAKPLSVATKALSASADGSDLHVFTADELRQLADNRLKIAESQLNARTDRRAGLGQSSSMGYVQSRGGTYLVDTTPQYGSNKKLAAEAQTRIDEAKADLAAAEVIGLKPLTVAPGESAWTPLSVATLPDGAASLQVTLAAAGETHIFTYAVSRKP